MFGRSAKPETVAQGLTVTATMINEGRFDPASYPYHHLAIEQIAKVGPPNGLLPQVMYAVETLGRAGWELAGFTIHHSTICAVMRRRPAGRAAAGG